MEKYKWDLSKIYKDEDAFLNELDYVKKEIIPAYQTLQGKLGTEEGMKKYLLLEREADLKISHLAMFASMRSDLDKKNIENAKDYSKIDLLFNEYSVATSFINPEILKLGKDYVDSFLKKNPEFNDFDFMFEKLSAKKSLFCQSNKKDLQAITLLFLVKGLSFTPCFLSLTISRRK